MYKQKPCNTVHGTFTEKSDHKIFRKQGFLFFNRK